MTEPLSEEQLSRIRANATGLWAQGDWNNAAEDVLALLAEVDRLRAENVAREKAAREGADTQMRALTAKLVLDEAIGDLL